jgi:MFS family permease
MRARGSRGRLAGQGGTLVAPDRPVPRRESLWRNANFHKFWAGEAISLFGIQVTMLALPLTAVITLRANAGDLGLIRFLQFFPYLVFALPFGVLVDRSRRRPVMIVANIARLLLIGLVPTLAVLGRLNAPILFAITFGIGAASALFDVTWMSYVPTLVRGDKQLLLGANSKLFATSAAADMAGPGVGGLLVSVLTAPIAMAVNAASYVVSVLSLMSIRLQEAKPERTKQKMIDELADGLRFVFRNRYLRVVAVVGGASNFFVSATLAMFLLYAVRDRGLSPSLVGVILSFLCIGGVLGAFTASWLVRRLRIGRAYLLTFSVALVMLQVIPAASGPRTVLVALYAAGFAISEWGFGAANVVVLSLRQSITPTSYLGRMNAAMRTIMYGLAAFGGPFGGAAATLFGLHTALWIASIGSALVLTPLLLSPVSRLLDIPPMAEVPDRHRDGARHTAEPEGA